jgi:hypothetical protein
MKKTYFTRDLLKIFGVTAILAMVVAIGVPQITKAAELYRQLEIGMRGNDVSSLQTFLATDRTIYPQGLVTGYFGTLTKSAVSNFQARNGISTVGRVGPQTMPVINAQMASGMGGVNHVGSDMSAPMISNVTLGTNQNSASINLMTNKASALIVYYSTMPMTMHEASASNGVSIYGTSHLAHTDLRTSHSTTIQGLMSNTTYYYVIYVRDASGNESVSVQSTFRTL